MKETLIVLFYLFAPLLILFLCEKSAILNKIGSVILAYIVGLVIGNVRFFNEYDLSIIEQIVNVSILIAIPLLLFSVNIKSWLKIAGTTMIAMITGIVSVLVIIVLGFFIIKDLIPDPWKISGLLVGVYSGGTPNLASLKAALDVDNDVYILTHTYDMLISSVYLLFLMFAGKKFFGLFLKKFNIKNKETVEHEINTETNIELSNLIGGKDKAKDLLIGFFIALSIGLTGVGVSFIVPEKNQMTVLILAITTLALIVSNFKYVKKIRSSYDLGMYLILIFSMGVASLADINKLAYSSPYILLYITVAIFGSLVLHSILSFIFKVDSDTFIITSTALICSPPLVPVVAGAIKNKTVLISGLTVGILGYALGNYLGIGIAYLLKNFV